ncbi:MAG: tripartite tricarboxylate transporter substrate binding protein [Acetobacteraceae bacterium]|nr:tripartite tricarboxylate transporter substrate binding protein [Acetobacteraceae bacterium]
MNLSRRALFPMLGGALGCTLAARPAAAADEYPNKSVRLIVPYPPGGSADLIARFVSDKLSRSLGQTVIVENKGGASGAIGSEYVARARPDGYTILMTTSDTLAINPAVFARLPYDPQKDFAPITLLAVQPFVLAVGPSVKAADFGAFIQAAKDKPGTVSFASNGAGGVQHLAMELLASAAGIKALHVPYNGAGPALSDVMGGHVDALFISLQGAGGSLKSGQLRALAITSPERLAIAPDVPTFAELGYASFHVQQWYGLVAPRATSAPVIARLNEQAAAGILASDVADKLKAAGTEPVGGSPDAFRTFLASEIVQWSDVAKANNIRIE